MDESWSLEVFSGTVYWFCRKTSFHPLLWTSSGLKGTWKLSAYIEKSTPNDGWDLPNTLTEISLICSPVWNAPYLVYSMYLRGWYFHCKSPEALVKVTKYINQLKLFPIWLACDLWKLWLEGHDILFIVIIRLHCRF